ncbi:YbaN family protein [Luteimonas kalidii]|uniref:Inner membrane protein n=1 Tax=Luteimonas kalidii TaxID=3042025 RepID=A0ABT6JV15_9GAMM|nr:YbaN family protein [Luteimonas kalidii]MDH5834529.1 YbaN family protein [Luteimonas kalidii]
MRPTPRHRWAWWLLAYVSLGLGIIGAFLPVMPTTVFVLIAAWAAARGSERLHRRLHAHARFGPAIRDWEAHGAVSRRAKWMATAMMLLSATILVGAMAFSGGHRWWMIALPVGCMAAVGTWLWRRPEPQSPVERVKAD